MTSFKDKSGAQWDIALTVGTAIKLKARLGVDIGQVINANGSGTGLLERLSNDLPLLFGVIYAVCEPAVTQRGLTEAEFAERFDGDTVSAATEALLDELVNFSQPATRVILRRLREISREFQQKAGKRLEELVTSEAFKAEILQGLSESPTSALESSAE